MKKKYKWTKKQERAIRATRKIWQKILDKVNQGYKIKSRWPKDGPLWSNNQKPVMGRSCPLCRFDCSECPYEIARGAWCCANNELLDRFERYPTKRTLTTIVRFLDGLLPKKETPCES